MRINIELDRSLTFNEGKPKDPALVSVHQRSTS
jgi:hypothetical protein